MSARILVVDNYDSFVYTLVSYIQELGAQTTVVRNDSLLFAEFVELSKDYDGILLSPGPGTPAEAGLSEKIIAHAAAQEIPLFGVCLGHQALGEVFGATVAHSPTLMHGKTSVIAHTDEGIMRGCRNPLTVTRYHSLAIVDDTLDTEVFRVVAETTDGIIMAIEHKQAPLAGVQFHPESVKTEDGYLMLGNFLSRCGMPGAPQQARGLSPLMDAAK